MKLPKLSGNISLLNKVSLVEILGFTKQLSLMLRSGIPLPESIKILSKRLKHKQFKDVLKVIHEEIANGQPFYKALSRFPRSFNTFYISLVKVSEESGTLEKNLDYLAKHLKKQHEFSGKIKGALMYPAIILAVALIAGVGLSVFVLPQLVDLFASLDAELPLQTKILLFFAQVMKDYGILILGGLILSFFGFRFAISSKVIKPRWHSFLLSFPIIGVLIQNIQIASIFRNLGTMLEAGMHISIALDAQIDTTTNSVYQRYLSEIREGVKKGKSIEEVLSTGSYKFIPFVAVKMIGVGENTGKLEETLNYLGEFFEDEVDDTSRNLSTIIEPIVLIFVGLLVAFIAFSIIGPIYQFTGSTGPR